MDRGTSAKVRGTELAAGYAGVVLAVAAVMQLMPAEQRQQIVLECSTNLTNLRQFPVRVLLLSAVVVQDLPDLLLLVPLVVAVTVATRWVGRAATTVALVFGHLFATLSVAVLIAAGLHHGLLDPAIARAPDVGTSYALAGTAGLLVARVRGWWRIGYLAAAVLVIVLLLATSPDFTQVGHAVAFTIGLALALVVRGGARAAVSGAGVPTEQGPDHGIGQEAATPGQHDQAAL